MIRSDAIISPCGTYRYRLSRTWDDALPPAVFVMLNPSTADASSDDPTVRKCIGFARRMGCGGLVVVNLFALRSTDPMALYKRADPVGPDNNRHIREALAIPGAVVIPAWGRYGRTKGRNIVVEGIIAAAGVEARPLARTLHGEPRHPLYLSYSLIKPEV